MYTLLDIHPQYTLSHDTPSHDTPSHDTPSHDTPSHDTPSHDNPSLYIPYRIARSVGAKDRGPEALRNRERVNSIGSAGGGSF